VGWLSFDPVRQLHKTSHPIYKYMNEIITDYLDAKQLADRLTALELHSTSELARLEKERDDALSQIAQAECRAERFCQERDEARTTIEDAKRALKATDYEGILLAAMRVKEERDEARDALMKIQDLFIDGTDIYADRENMGTIAREALEGAK